MDFGAAGGAVGDIFGAIGAFSSASAYGKAASIEKQNAALTARATAIQETQTQRQIYQAIGAQKAAVGASGFMSSGSATDLLRSSTQQGALAKTLVSTQGLITENNFMSQAAAFDAQQQASEMAGIGKSIGAALDIFALF